MSQSDAEFQLKDLYPKLMARADGFQLMEDYYSGEHPLPFLTPAHAKKMRSSFRQMLEESRSNFMRLLVDVVDERLQVEGIRLSASSDLQSDKESWDIWQANQMDSLHRAAILDSLIKGISYVSVWEDADGDGFADIAIEDAREMIIAYEPGSNFRRRQAALKVWREGEWERANVWLPDAVWKFRRNSSKAKADPASQWQLIPEDFHIEHDLGVVPIIPIRNRPRTLVEGESELADAYPVQNQINGFIFLLALAGYFGAHKQRWATGLTLIEDEDTGDVKEPFDVAIDKLLVSEDSETKFGEFQQTDLQGYLKSIDQKVSHLAITTRTPKHYLLPDGQDPSGDAIQSAESGLNKRTERKQSIGGEALEEVMRLARKAQGLGDTPVDSEIVWADAATISEAVRTDSVIKQFESGLIPAEIALEKLGYSQTQITKIMTARAAEAILAAFKKPDEPKTPDEPAGR